MQYHMVRAMSKGGGTASICNECATHHYGCIGGRPPLTAGTRPRGDSWPRLPHLLALALLPCRHEALRDDLLLLWLLLRGCCCAVACGRPIACCCPVACLRCRTVACLGAVGCGLSAIAGCLCAIALHLRMAHV